jgi:L-amino acid N-acyltransferase YncA
MSQITIYTYYVKETNTKFNVKKISLEKIIEKFIRIKNLLFLKYAIVILKISSLKINILTDYQIILVLV